jgi:hypothetical protein
MQSTCIPFIFSLQVSVLSLQVIIRDSDSELFQNESFGAGLLYHHLQN